MWTSFWSLLKASWNPFVLLSKLSANVRGWARRWLGWVRSFTDAELSWVATLQCVSLLLKRNRLDGSDNKMSDLAENSFLVWLLLNCSACTSPSAVFSCGHSVVDSMQSCCDLSPSQFLYHSVWAVCLHVKPECVWACVFPMMPMFWCVLLMNPLSEP